MFCMLPMPATTVKKMTSPITARIILMKAVPSGCRVTAMLGQKYPNRTPTAMRDQHQDRQVLVERLALPADVDGMR